MIKSLGKGGYCYDIITLQGKKSMGYIFFKEDGSITFEPIYSNYPNASIRKSIKELLFVLQIFEESNIS